MGRSRGAADLEEQPPGSAKRVGCGVVLVAQYSSQRQSGP